MTQQAPNSAILTLLNTARYSLANYLRFARPWTGRSAQFIAQTISRIADSHRRHVARVGDLLVERHGHAESGTFPMSFAGLNDLSVEYLLPLVIEDQKRIVSAIENLAHSLQCDAEASELAAGIAQTEKHHLRTLEEIAEVHGNRRPAGLSEEAMPRRAAGRTSVLSGSRRHRRSASQPNARLSAKRRQPVRA